MEKWEPYPLDNDYEISTIGNVRSFKGGRSTPRKMSPGIDNTGYYRVVMTIDGKVKYKRVHRILAETFIGDIKEGLIVDHIDRNKLNNRLDNIRIISPEASSCNTRGAYSASSKYKGVYFKKRDNKWVAEIMLNRKHIVIGIFDNEIEAAKAYDKECLKLHGEYSVTNKKLGII